MKKIFKPYALIWAILFAAWCAIVFLVQPVIPGFVFRYDARFWTAFVFIVAAFIGNIVCAYLAFKAETIEKLFLNLPLITVSRAALIAMLVAGSALMAIPDCPAWIAAVVSVLILAFNVVAIIKASWAAEEVSRVDEKVKAKISFIKNLTVDTENILSRAKSEDVKKECRKVYEAVRYSDPMSVETLSVIEAKITVKADEFSDAVGDDNLEKVKAIADEIVMLVTERNKKCRALK